MKVKVFNIRLVDKYLEQDQNQVNNFLAEVEMKKSSSSLVSGDEHFWSVLIHYKEKSQMADVVQEKADEFISATSTTQLKSTQEPEAKEKPEKISIDDLNKTEIYILDNLKSWRAERAREEQIPPYMILWDQHLMEVIKAKPSSPDELLNVKGFGPAKVEKFGTDVLNILGAF